MRARWPNDAGGGTDASEAATRPLGAFNAELAEPGWLTEDPELHLGPKLRVWLAAHPEWTLRESRVRDDGTWEIRAHLGGGSRARDRRAAATALIGSFAEDRLFVTEDRGGGHEFAVATGQPAHDGFRAHGHLVRLVIV